MYTKYEYFGSKSTKSSLLGGKSRDETRLVIHCIIKEFVCIHCMHRIITKLVILDNQFEEFLLCIHCIHRVISLLIMQWITNQASPRLFFPPYKEFFFVLFEPKIFPDWRGSLLLSRDTNKSLFIRRGYERCGDKSLFRGTLFNSRVPHQLYWITYVFLVWPPPPCLRVRIGN